MTKHFRDCFDRDSIGQRDRRSEGMPRKMAGHGLINSAYRSDLFQIAALLSLQTLYQRITNNVFRRGNDLVTVLLTLVCLFLQVSDNLFKDK